MHSLDVNALLFVRKKGFYMAIYNKIPACYTYEFHV